MLGRYAFSIVVGIGNTIAGDDGVGVFVAERLVDALPCEFRRPLAAGVSQLHADAGSAAAVHEVDAIQAAYNAGSATLDRLLDAQRRRSDSEVAAAGTAPRASSTSARKVASAASYIGRGGNAVVVSELMASPFGSC